MSYKVEKEQNDLLKIREKLSAMPEFLTGYMRSKADNSSTSSRLAYLSDYKIFFEYLVSIKKVISIKDMKLADLKHITPNDIDNFLEHIGYRNEGGRVYTCGRKAKARKLSALNDLYTYAIRETRLYEDAENRITENPIKYINPIKIPDDSIRTLKKEEAQQILINMNNGINSMNERQKAYNDNTRDRDIAIFTVFITTGVRLSELQALNLSDVDFDEKFILIEKGKRDKTRLVALTEDAEIALNCYLVSRNIIKIEADALFLSIQNRRMHVNSIRNVIMKYSEGKTSCHKLRKTYGTILYKETGDIQLVADALGHDNINTTRKYYAKSDTDKRLNVTRNICIV